PRPPYCRPRHYRARPADPKIVARSVHDATAVGRRADLVGSVDVIEIFRRPEYLPDHAREILALDWRPMAVWFQLGIRNDVAAEMLAHVGIRVVQDRCMMPEHKRLVAMIGFH